MIDNEHSKQPITINTFGSFSIKQGHLVVSQQSGRSKLLWNVFLFLLSNRPRSFHPEIILKSIYPHKQYADPSAVMRNQLYLLRQELAFGKKEASLANNLVYSSGRYRWDDRIWCKTDAEKFESLVDKARELAREHPEESISHILEALKIYKNGYLADFTDSDWVIPFRSHFHDLYLSAVLELVALFKKKKAYQDISHICEQALAIDYFDERIHISLIEALLASGLTNLARAHYDEATATFYHEMGIKPSSAMKSLYWTIKHQSGDSELNPARFAEYLTANFNNCEGACFVDPEVFRHIIRYELQRDVIKSRPLFACLLTLTGQGYAMPNQVILEEAMDKLNEAILRFLCHKDVFTRWNDCQYLILLPGLSREQANKAMERINYNFRILSPGKVLVLHRKVADINPTTRGSDREPRDYVDKSD